MSEAAIRLIIDRLSAVEVAVRALVSLEARLRRVERALWMVTGFALAAGWGAAQTWGV